MSLTTHLWATVVLEPDPLARFAVQSLLARASLRVVHSCGDAAEAVERCLAEDAGVFLTELALPDARFRDVAQRLLGERPQLRIVVFTSEQDPELLQEAREAGACAILSKYSEPENLGTKIAATRKGALLLDETTAPLVLGTGGDPNPPTLTDRETDILRMLAGGAKLGAIGRALGLADSTVKSHAAKAAAKLGVETSKKAAAKAARLGLLVESLPQL